MSHELRTPLNSSLILAKLLHDNRDGNLTPEQVKYADSIYSAGNHLLALINDILDLSKIEARKLQLEVGPVTVTRIVNDLESLFRPLTEGKALELSVEISAGCPETIYTDQQRLTQILSNLLSNAVKFTENGSIRLRAESPEPEHIAFTVEDTGIGIPADQHEIIFDAFRQADGTTSRKFGGTGLGLSICRELAALLGCELRLRSAPGEGSAFTLLLPHRKEGSAVVRRAATTAIESPLPERADPPEAPRFIEDDAAAILDPRRVVLIVEDDPAFAAILRDLGRELGFQCVVGASADDGLRLAQTYHPVAVMLDIGLPDQSGLTVLELLKRDPSIRHVPIHIISAHDYEHVARAMGAVGYALKPVKREEIVSAFRLLRERLSRRLKSLLVVEDDDVQRDAIAKLLGSDDVAIIAVRDADEALTRLRSTTFDCVVLDLMLPGVDGFDLLDRMSADGGASFPPVIVYTARPLDRDEEFRLRRVSKSIIVKGARSPERLLEEVTLFLHQVESKLAPHKRQMLRIARDREAVFEGRRVLLVEDDVRNVFALTSLIQPKGVTVDVARNGSEALAKLAESPSLDLVLMDIMMPEMDGLEATRRIRQNEQWSSLPIIALTAKAMPDDRAQCLAAGASDYIAKPIDPDKLLSLMRVWMPR